MVEKALILINKLTTKKDKYTALYEIFNILFLIKDLIDKDKFIYLLNNIKDEDMKYLIIQKCLSLNDINYFDYKNEKRYIAFNKNLSFFLKKIEFLKIDNLKKIK